MSFTTTTPPANPTTGFDVDFGVEVTRIFDPHGQVTCVTTPSGRAALTVHRGPYGGLAAAYAALRDWPEDESKLETTIVYALA